MAIFVTHENIFPAVLVVDHAGKQRKTGDAKRAPIAVNVI